MCPKIPTMFQKFVLLTSPGLTDQVLVLDTTATTLECEV